MRGISSVGRALRSRRVAAGQSHYSGVKHGELAQLVERCDRTAEVRSSNLLFSIPFSL